MLLAHDMGTSVATELLARDLSGALPFELQRAVLTNGSVIIERASLRPSQKILRGPLGPLFSRLAGERRFMRGFARLFSAQHPLSPEEAEAQWALLAREDGQRILHLLCAYLNERVRFAPRWHGAVRDWPKPLGFLWATGDPVATTEVLAGLRELRPAAQVIELPGIGHYPQIEVPDEFTADATELLGLSVRQHRGDGGRQVRRVRRADVLIAPARQLRHGLPRRAVRIVTEVDDVDRDRTVRVGGGLDEVLQSGGVQRLVGVRALGDHQHRVALPLAVVGQCVVINQAQRGERHRTGTRRRQTGQRPAQRRRAGAGRRPDRTVAPGG